MPETETKDEIERLFLVYEYQMKDRLNEWLWTRATRFGTIVGIVSTVLALIGAPALMSYLVSRVVDDVKTTIAQQTRSMTDTLAADIARIKLTAATLDGEAEKARDTLNSFEALRKKTQETQASVKTDLEKLHSDYAGLVETADYLRKRADQALDLATTASRDTKTLQTAVVDTSIGKPALVSWGFGAAASRMLSTDYQPPREAEVSGTNFGSKSGQIFTVVQKFPAKLINEGISESEFIKSSPFPLSPKSITSWSDSQVKITFQAEDRAKILSTLNEMGRSRAEGATLFFIVETADGQQTR